VLLDDLTDPTELVGREPEVRRKCDRIEPEFAAVAVTLGVNVHGFVTVKTVEE
jgi:hypothetical protein